MRTAIAILAALLPAVCVHSASASVSVTWLGHSEFLIKPSTGPVVVTDPFDARVGSYPLRHPTADVVTVSHEHFDHNAVGEVRGRFQVIRGVGSHVVHGVDLKGVATFHDQVSGRQRGPNTVFVFRLDGITFCHLGDLGHLLSPQQLKAIGPVDVLMIPVGGTFTIDAKMADEVVHQLKPKVVLPMHYKTRYTAASLPLAGLQPFIEGKSNVRTEKGDTITLTPASLPKTTTIIVLQ
jgi:L-ascorbate metabolism protein UlaG (beta-lactamase superfamily)